MRENKETRFGTLSLPKGSSASAALALGLEVESLLPNSTFQLGPPSYYIISNNNQTKSASVATIFIFIVPFHGWLVYHLCVSFYN